MMPPVREGGDEATSPESPFARAEFVHEFRTYQRIILDRLAPRLDAPGDDERFHLVAPPGSGKTILGIELARRLGERAVVFSPTTTIQSQWVDKAALFAPVDDDAPDRLASTRPADAVALRSLTYQLVSTVGGDAEALEYAARQHWQRELVRRDPDDEQAIAARLDLMEVNNPAAYAKEIKRRTRLARREALRKPDASIGDLLHPNARGLIDQLVASGVRTVILDECHHLLDYWAIVISYLIAKIDTPRVIGLTATLPSPEDESTFENYTTLLGEVTYEVPVPAVVKSGDLAPYRDLAAFTTPLDDEAAYLDNAMATFRELVRQICADFGFTRWIQSGDAGRGATARERWDWLLANDTPLAVSILRHAKAARLDLEQAWMHREPTEDPHAEPFPVPFEAFQAPTHTDSIVAIERYALHHLKVSTDPVDRARLTAIKEALRPFGYGLTERGLRQRRPVAESVLSYSLAKTHAAARILRAEANALGARFRAVVVADYERTGSLMPGEKGVEARGSARRIFSELTSHPETHDLDPVLVTGKTLWIDADHGTALIDWFNEWLDAEGIDARCTAKEHRHRTVLEVAGEGPGWRTGVYVRMVTAAFEQGRIRVLVGTRGLFAEGWDALSLAVLVDLTTASTSTATQQLRGRTLRLDPSWPLKVGHNWDVVCLPPGTDAPPAGYVDLHRLERRHLHLWGITPDYPGVMAEHVGRIARGVHHVDPDIAVQRRVLAAPPQLPMQHDAHHRARRKLTEATGRALAQASRREWSHDVWGVGGGFDDESSTAATLTPPTMPLRTAHTVSNTLRAMAAQFRGMLASLLLSGIAQALPARGSGGSIAELLGIAAVGLLVAAVITGVIGTISAVKIYRRVMAGDHPDFALKDIGRAVATALRERGLVDASVQPEDVVVLETPALDYEVRLARASAQDADLFARSMAEALAPIDRQRYLISRDVSRLPAMWLRPLWAALRRIAGGDSGVTWHAVPDALGARKEGALAYSRVWRREVGAGELVYTKNPAGFAMLQRVRTAEQPHAEGGVYDIWR